MSKTNPFTHVVLPSRPALVCAALLASLLPAFQPKCHAGEIFSENFDSSPALPAGWTISSGVSWSLSSVKSDTFPNAMFVSSSGASINATLTSPPILIPTPLSKLRFRHSYQLGYFSHGGKLEISVSGGPFTDLTVAGGTFLTNGYSDSQGWSGNANSFVTTEAFLPPTVAGLTVQLRWRFTASQSGGLWYVDTVSLSDGMVLPPDDLSVTLTDLPDPVAIGANLTYLVKVTNTGPSTATAVLLTNVLPPNVTVVSNLPSAGTSSNLNGTIICSFGNIVGQGTATLKVVVQPQANGLLTNRVFVARGEPDVYLLNNSATTVTTVASPSLYTGNMSFLENDSGPTNVSLAVFLMPASPNTVTVNYTTTNGTAVSGMDYSGSSGTLTFAPGETLKTIPVPILGDELDEDNETFQLRISGASNAGIIVDSGFITIVDNDDPPYAVVLDATITEGDSGQTLALFPVILTEPSGRFVSVTCQTGNGTAMYPADFVFTNITVVFPPGTTFQTVAIEVSGDRIPEPNEYFYLYAQSFSNASTFNYSSLGWILNDDGLPGQIHHFSWDEIGSPTLLGLPMNVTLTARDYFGNTASNFSGPVSLSAATAAQGVTGNILGFPVTSDNNASYQVGGYAFTPNTNLVVTHIRHFSGERVSLSLDNGTLLFDQPVDSVPGTWTLTPLPFPIQLGAGVKYRLLVLRGSQYLYLNYSRPTQFAHGTIDAGFVGYSENPEYSSTSLWFVDLGYSVGTLQSLAIDPVTSGEFVNGVWSGTITPLQEGTSVRLYANDPQGHNGISNPFDVLVTNDVSLKIFSAPNPAGVAAPLQYTIRITNSGPAVATSLRVTNWLPPSVTFVSASSSQGLCTNLGSYVVCNFGTLAGQSAAEMIINVQTKTIGNLTNTATISRGEPDFALANNTATVVTAVAPPGLRVDDSLVVEGNGVIAPLTFQVRLFPASGQTVSVNYSVAPGTAVAGVDYNPTNGTLIFAPGQTNLAVIVPVIGDILNETNESLYINLSNPSNATIADSQAFGQILNDDPLPALFIYDAFVLEGNAGTTNALFTLALSAPSGLPISVYYYSYDSTAKGQEDYFDDNETVVFPPGTTTQTVAIAVSGDRRVENTEIFYVSINWDNAQLGRAQATGYIINDDGLPGELHHFAWNVIASPQYAGGLIPVTLSARDYWNNVASVFNGQAVLSAYRVSSEISDSLLRSPVHSFFNSSSSQTLGYSFTPNVDLLVTHVRHYFGSKVSIWDNSGLVVASQAVSSTPGTWKSTPLSSPVLLAAGVQYRIGTYIPSGNSYWRNDGNVTFAHGTLDQAVYGDGDSFPQFASYPQWWFVDLEYVVQTADPVPFKPVTTATLINGQWTGFLSLLETGESMFLRSDALGLSAVSNPFEVAEVQLALTQAGANALLHWPSAASGFVLESATNMASPTLWSPTTNTPVNIGLLNVVTNRISAGQTYFRLKSQ